MRTSLWLLSIVMAMVLVAVPMSSDDSEAAVPEPDEVVYFFTYDLSFFFEGVSQPNDVEWEALGIDKGDGSEIEMTLLGNPSSENAWTVTLDRNQVSRCSDVYVTQTVYGDGTVSSMTCRCIILGDISVTDPILVNFYDGYSGALVESVPIYPDKEVVFGTPFVEVPDAPEREGYDFVGWFFGAGLSERFDPYEPITGDVDVYARWNSTSGQGTTGSITISNHLITFECSPGLTYEIVSTGSDSVTFTVSELSGFDVMDGSITVTANGEPLNGDDGTYVLSDIHSDVLVEISGEFVSENGESTGDDGGIPLWVWILILVIILIMIAVILWMHSRNARQLP